MEEKLNKLFKFTKYFLVKSSFQNRSFVATVELGKMSGLPQRDFVSKKSNKKGE